MSRHLLWSRESNHHHRTSTPVTCSHMTRNGVYGGKVWSMNTITHTILVIHEIVISACIHRRLGSGGSMGSSLPSVSNRINTKPTCNIQYSFPTFQILYYCSHFHSPASAADPLYSRVIADSRTNKSMGLVKGGTHDHHEMPLLHRSNGWLLQHLHFCDYRHSACRPLDKHIQVDS